MMAYNALAREIEQIEWIRVARGDCFLINLERESGGFHRCQCRIKPSAPRAISQIALRAQKRRASFYSLDLIPLGRDYVQGGAKRFIGQARR